MSNLFFAGSYLSKNDSFLTISKSEAVKKSVSLWLQKNYLIKL